jgi:RsiW-degrading membrane proteinase PrsW (M82 family)
MAEKPKAKNWQLILCIVLSALAILYFLIQSLVLGFFCLLDLLSAQGDLTQVITTGLLAWASILSVFLLLPVLLLSIFHLRSKPIPTWLDTNRTVIPKVVMWLIIIWPVFVFIGWFIAGTPQAAAFLLGPINIIAAGLPVLWTYNAAQWKLKAGSQFRKWQIFGFSFVVAPMLISLIELVVLLSLGLIVLLWASYKVSIDPSFEHAVVYVYTKVQLAGDDLEVAVKLLESFLMQPSIIFWVAAIFSGVIPIIEEICKPLALWFLAGRDITEKDGFIYGVLCGAGFALMENVLYATAFTTAEDWFFITIGRAGTGVLHMLASGLVGWGLVKSWREGKWRFQLLTTLVAVLLHGLWNLFALFSGMAPVFIYGLETTLWQNLMYYAPLLLLLIVYAGGLFLIRRYFIKKQPSEQSVEKMSVDGN